MKWTIYIGEAYIWMARLATAFLQNKGNATGVTSARGRVPSEI